MKILIGLAAISISLAACDSTTHTGVAQADAPAWMAVVDKTLVSGDRSVTLNSDGTVIGTGIDGLWQERDGKFCRTLTLPVAAAGTQCQNVMIDGDTISFENNNGSLSTWTIPS